MTSKKNPTKQKKKNRKEKSPTLTTSEINAVKHSSTQ